MIFPNLNNINFQQRDYSPLNTPNGISLKHDPTIPSEEAITTPNKNDYPSTEGPRTPTPFKKALADLEKKSGPITHLPDTPTRLEDITEIMKKEQDISSNYETDTSLMISVKQTTSFCLQVNYIHFFINRMIVDILPENEKPHQGWHPAKKMYCRAKEFVRL